MSDLTVLLERTLFTKSLGVGYILDGGTQSNHNYVAQEQAR